MCVIFIQYIYTLYDYQCQLCSFRCSKIMELMQRKASSYTTTVKYRRRCATMHSFHIVVRVYLWMRILYTRPNWETPYIRIESQYWGDIARPGASRDGTAIGSDAFMYKIRSSFKRKLNSGRIILFQGNWEYSLIRNCWIEISSEL